MFVSQKLQETTKDSQEHLDTLHHQITNTKYKNSNIPYGVGTSIMENYC
jgi:hypothetical protein